MPESLTQRIHMELLDLLDDVKVDLIELNNQANLVTYGPPHQLIKRGTRMAYVQGQKQAIDHILTLIEQQSESEVIEQYDHYQEQISTTYHQSIQDFVQHTNIPRQFEALIAEVYHLKGQYFIITHINSVLAEYDTEY